MVSNWSSKELNWAFWSGQERNSLGFQDRRTTPNVGQWCVGRWQTGKSSRWMKETKSSWILQFSKIYTCEQNTFFHIGRLNSQQLPMINFLCVEDNNQTTWRKNRKNGRYRTLWDSSWINTIAIRCIPSPETIAALYQHVNVMHDLTIIAYIIVNSWKNITTMLVVFWEDCMAYLELTSYAY